MLNQSITPSKAILMTFGLAFAGLFVFLFVGVVANAIIFGTLSADAIISPSTASPEGLLAIKILQMFQTTGIFLFPALVITFMLSKNHINFLGFKIPQVKLLLLSVLLMIILIPGINLIASLNATIPLPEWMIHYEEQAERLVKSMLITNKIGVYAFNLLVVAVLPAIAEELFFRSVLQKLFISLTRNIFAGIVIASIVFSAFHMQFQGFIPRVLLGLLFGYLYVWSGSIWIPIVVHFVNNALAVTIYYFMGKGLVPDSVDTLGNLNQMWPLGIISLVAGTLIAWIIWERRFSKPQSPPDSSQEVQVL